MSTIGHVLGRALRIEEISPEEARRVLPTIIPASVLNMLLHARAAGIGQRTYIETTLPSRLSGNIGTIHLVQRETPWDDANRPIVDQGLPTTEQAAGLLPARRKLRKFRARRFGRLGRRRHVNVRHRNTSRRLVAEIPEYVVHHGITCHL